MPYYFNKNNSILFQAKNTSKRISLPMFPTLAEYDQNRLINRINHFYEKKAVCVIPARGGSKRIPRKNIKEFLGKPVISYSIESAISSNIFDDVFVSTDDKEIAEISKKYGAKADILRSDSSSNDNATTAEVISEILTYERYKSAEFICCLYPVAPLIDKNLLEGHLISLVMKTLIVSFQLQSMITLFNDD